MKRPLSIPSPVRALSHARGFSVMELLVAVSLLAVIVVGLLAMFNQTQKAFRGGMAQTDVMESGRIVMQFLTREMEQIAPTEDPGATNLMMWTPTSRTPPSSTMDLPNNLVRDNRLQDITFLSRLNDEWLATAYRVSNAVEGAGALYRWSAAYTNGVSPGTLSNFCRLATSLPAPTPAVTDTNFQFIADGVAHLAAYPYATNGIPLTSHPLLVGRVIRGYGYPGDDLPAFLDLELGVLEPRSVAKFYAQPPANRVAWLSDQAARMHLFVQRIPLRNAP